MNAQYDKIIVALDYQDPEPAYRLVDQIGEKIQWYKVGPQLFLRSGNEIIKFLQKNKKQIFLDLKVHDTPQVVEETIKQIADMGIQLATVHCLGGRKMLEVASQSCRNSQLRLIGITLLTSHSPTDSSFFGWSMKDAEFTSRLLDLAVETRLSGVMCSPFDAEALRKKVMSDFLLISAGIRLNGQAVFRDDQHRTAAPKEALTWGADYLVVGRPITLAREPREVVDGLFA